MKKILILNGPSLNFLGIREPEIYGNETYKDLIKLIKGFTKGKKIRTKIVQSNYEGRLIYEIQKAYKHKYDGILINPGAYTHTSIALRDALKSVNIKTVEVHISKVENREDFRKVDYIKDCCIGYVTGEGIDGYITALKKLLKESGK